MEGLERIRLYFNQKPEMIPRAIITAVFVAVAIPAWWWIVRSSEKKAYERFTSGYYSYRNSNYSQAAASLGDLVTNYRNSKFTALGRYYLALSHMATNNLEAAASELKFFMDENPKHFLRDRAYAISMAVELNSGRPDKCVELADRYLTEFGRESPSAPELLYRKCVACQVLGNPQEASKSFAEAVESSKDGGNIFGNFAFYAQTAAPQM